jgi:hypothetical protein
MSSNILFPHRVTCLTNASELLIQVLRETQALQEVHTARLQGLRSKKGS